MSGIKILENARWVVLVALLGLAQGHALRAQAPDNYRYLRFQFGVQTPMGDLKDRFGVSNAIGTAIEHASVKTRWLFGLQGGYFFGNRVKEDVLFGIRAFDGTIIGIDGFPGDVVLKERGYYAGAYTGRIFPLSPAAHPMTGIRAEAGLGFMQHKIRVQDNFSTVVAVEPENLPGYDRLTNGGAFTLALGYQYHHPVNNVHFHLMAELIGAATASRRDFDYAADAPLDDTRLDLLGGIRAAWIFTISRKRSADSIIY
jgi:hypothetical protein